MNIEIKLKPCPFCGGKHISLWENQDGLCHVECRDCNVETTYTVPPNAREKAVRMWNRRVKNDAD